jgi:hypothetical protein
MNDELRKGAMLLCYFLAPFSTGPLYMIALLGKPAKSLVSLENNNSQVVLQLAWCLGFTGYNLASSRLALIGFR